MMIDPFAITDYDRDDASLQEVLLFWGCAAGKNGAATARALERFLSRIDPERSSLPFDAVLQVPEKDLPVLLKESGIGNYHGRTRFMRELATSGLDLRSCSIEELEAIRGVGMKTSRCFVLHSRKGARVAGLDTHVRKYLRERGHAIPLEGSLSRSEYLRYEQVFLDIADSLGKTSAELDLEVWSARAVSRPS